MKETENTEEKKLLASHIQDLIYLKFFKEDQTSLSINVDKNTAVFICSWEITDQLINEFNAILSKIKEIVDKKQTFQLININEGDAAEFLDNDINVKTLCTSITKLDTGWLELILYWMPDDVENNKNRILKVFSDYCPVQETIKLPIKDINRSIFKALIKSNELTKGARENYFITEMKLSSGK